MGSSEQTTGPAWWSLSLPGVALGTLLAALSTTPSLLPRPPLFQGVVTGLAFAAGYLAGAVAGSLLGRLLTWRHPVNRPGMSGDSKLWEGWSHAREHIEEVSG